MTNLEEVAEVDEPRTYRQQPFHRRILVASAGSIMHYVMAFVLAWVAVVAFGTPSKNQVVVYGFVKWAGHSETAAQAAGLQPGERIVSVGGKAVATPTALASAIQASRGKPVTMVVTDHGRRSTKVVQPVAGHKEGTREILGTAKGKTTDWLVGVATQIEPLFVSQNPLAAVVSAADDVGHVTSATVVGIGHVFSPGGIAALYDQVTNPQTAARAAKNPQSSSRVMSIVEATRLATQAEQQGVYYFLSVLIALNIVIGLMNMLPMLPLDGGHVAIAVYERIRTRRGRPYYHADAAKLVPVAYAFMAVLLLIVGSAVFLDIAHPVANPFG
jgi:membrane-associated protease RseP (regulator of RpoE activity)